MAAVTGIPRKDILVIYLRLQTTLVDIYTIDDVTYVAVAAGILFGHWLLAACMMRSNGTVVTKSITKPTDLP